MSLTLFNDKFFSDPFYDMRKLQRHFDKNFAAGNELASWNPAIDIKSTDSEVTLHAELPGVKKEDISLELHNGILTVSGKKEQEKKVDNEKYHRTERYFGSFSRSISVPEGVTDKDIKAKIDNGVLEVTFPNKTAKKDEAKKITVN